MEEKRISEFLSYFHDPMLPTATTKPVPAREFRTISFKDGMFLIRFSGSQFEALRDACRNLPRRSWNGIIKCWEVPGQFATEIQQLADEFKFSLTLEARNQISAESSQVVTLIERSRHTDSDIEIIGLKRVLYPYQRAGVAFGVEHKKFINADEMGLGKTAQSIATVVKLDAFPCLIICPSSLKFNWRNEWREWVGRPAVIPEHYSPYLPERFPIIIVNYESLHKYAGIFDKFKSVIVDEAHMIKNYKAKRTMLVKDATKKKEVVILLTGTPVLNRPAELLSMLGVIGKLKDFGGFQTFLSDYCQPWSKGNLRLLGDRLRTSCLIRREKKDVLTDLPDKIRQRLDVSLSNRREYVEMENEFRKLILEAQKNKPDAAMAMALVELQKLRQVAAKGKIAATLELCEQIWENGEKVIVFCYHKEIATLLCAALKTTLRITGDEDMEQRNRAVQAFQHNTAEKTVICSLKAAGVGLTLTAASKVVFVEMEWTPGMNDQAEDRAHRIGQKDVVTAYYLVATETVDEHLWRVVEKKRRIVKQITEGNYSGTSQEDRKGAASEVIADLLSRKG